MIKLGTLDILSLPGFSKVYLGSDVVFDSSSSESLERIGNWSKSVTLNLSSYDTADYSYYSISNTQNAYTIIGSSNYCQVALTRGESANTYIYFKFDTSSIPSNATIDSIGGKLKIYISNTTAANIASRGAKMCSGTTEKTAAVSATTTVSTRTFTMGTWTREELNDVRVKLYATRGTSNTNSNYYFRIYGAELSVDYTYQTTIYKVVVENNVSGLTVTPMTQEYASGETASVTFSGLSSGFTVKDNDVDVTSSLVASGDNLVYTISNIAAGHRIIVT